MRLFTAIIFDRNIEDSLYVAVERLRNNSKSGTFTTKENLHLTINFIGETKRIDEVKQSMTDAVKKTQTSRFQLLLTGFGKFKRREGDIYWVGVEKDDVLWKLQKQLAKELKEAGFFDIDDTEYTPHLTLGRRVMVKDTFNSEEFEAGIQPLQMEVARISLMKSERIQGKLVYTEVFQVPLDNILN